MLSKRSLGISFFFEIAVIMTAILIVITIFISISIPSYIQHNIERDLQKQAESIVLNYPDEKAFFEHFDKFNLRRVFNIEVKIVEQNRQLNIERVAVGNRLYIKFPYSYPNSDKTLIITKDITHEKNLLKKIYWTMLGIVVVLFIFILFAASKLSSQVMKPLHELTHKLSNMNESLLQPIKNEKLPSEFEQLGDAFNNLINKIKTSINYRKELYVGTAHELKTPLAVMRLKTQITLMKYKKQDKVRETLQQNIESIDTLNNMIHNILEYGRAEGGQFEQPKRVNIIRFMAQKAEEYELLAHSQNRDFIYNFGVERFMISIQPLLFMQIFQNFIQNALKFTPEGGLVALSVRTDEKNFIVEITDEGKGIDESQNLFAPFKRSAESTGAGLGLFLAQNAAESMGVKIYLKNRKDRQGAIASIIFPFNRFLHNER